MRNEIKHKENDREHKKKEKKHKKKKNEHLSVRREFVPDVVGWHRESRVLARTGGVLRGKGGLQGGFVLQKLVMHGAPQSDAAVFDGFDHHFCADLGGWLKKDES